MSRRLSLTAKELHDLKNAGASLRRLVTLQAALRSGIRAGKTRAELRSEVEESIRLLRSYISLFGALFHRHHPEDVMTVASQNRALERALGEVIDAISRGIGYREGASSLLDELDQRLADCMATLGIMEEEAHPTNDPEGYPGTDDSRIAAVIQKNSDHPIDATKAIFDVALLNPERWIDDKGELCEITISGPRVPDNQVFTRQWILQVDALGRPERQMNVTVELDDVYVRHLGLDVQDRRAKFEACLLDATKQALFMGRLTGSETMALRDNDKNVLAMQYTHSPSLADLASARFVFTKDPDYELRLADAIRRRILLTLKPHYTTGMSAQELVRDVGLGSNLVSDHVEWLRDNYHVRFEFSGSDPGQSRLWITEGGVKAISATAAPQPDVGPKPEGRIHRDINLLLGGDVVEKKIVQSADGSSGPVAQVAGDVGGSVNVNQTWKELAADVDLDELATQLEQLRAAMRGLAKSAEQDVAVGAVAEAAQAAKVKEGPRTLRALSKAGKWALDVAVRVGAPLLVQVLKKALGLPT